MTRGRVSSLVSAVALRALPAFPLLLLFLSFSTAARSVPVPSPRPRAVSLAGRLLVATPEMPDRRFVRTLIYMVRHDASGAMGLVLNRPIREIALVRLLSDLGLDTEGASGTIRVHHGGPVEPTRGFVLHSAEYAGKGTLLVNENVSLTAGPEVLRHIAIGAGPRRSLFALGYAGWGPGQIEAEIEAGGWFNVPADDALVFDEDHESKWDRARSRRKIDL